MASTQLERQGRAHGTIQPLLRWGALGQVSLLALVLGCTAKVEGGPYAGPQGSGAAGSGATVATGGGAGTGQGGSAGSSAATGGTGGGGAATGGSAGVGGSGGGTTDSGINLGGVPEYFRFVRLTASQWESSVRDLLKLSALPGLSSGFAPDPPNGTFTNNERALFVSSDLRTDYQRAAETLAGQVAGNAQARAGVTGGTTDAATFIRTFGRRAFRRPLTTDEETRYKTVFDSGATLLASGDAFVDGVHMIIESMLQSPNFLYRMELGTDGAPLSGYEMAAKLSFLVRDTTPDDALLDAAAAGQLDTAAGVLAKATQMLDEPAGKAVMGRYHAELFGLDRYSQIDHNKTTFPKYTTALNAEYQAADQLFFDRIFSAGQGVRDILTSPVAFVSSTTAAFYGVTASGTALTEMQLGPERPGYLTRLGFLSLNATLNDPDPIHRGVDIINRLMCAELAPPPGTIPPLPTIMPGQTNRERVNAFTGPGTCGEGCHGAIINPIGFAFENFDAIGQIRSMDNGKPIDTTGEVEFASGVKQFAGAPELTAVLADEPSVHGCYAMHLAEYTLARDIAGNDRTLVDSIEGMSMNDNASVKNIVLAIIGEPSFLTRTGGAL